MDMDVFFSLADQSGETSLDHRLLDIMYLLIGSWNSPKESEEDVTMDDLWNLAEHFSETAERYESNQRFFQTIHNAVIACTAVPQKRLL